jgi:hypothetical protein
MLVRPSFAIDCLHDLQFAAAATRPPCHALAARLSMLARRANGAFVCLRCQLHAARPSPRLRLLPTTAPAAHARFYASSPLPHDALSKVDAQGDGIDNASANANASTDTDTPTNAPEKDHNVEPASKITSINTPETDHNVAPALKITRDWPQKPKPHKAKRGRAVLSNMTSLGSEANILVLGDVGRRSKKADLPPPEPIAPIEIEAPNLLKSLQRDSPPPSPEEINKQIDILRPSESNSPSEPHRLTSRAFVKLTRSLCKGFTAKQLSGYYAAAKNLSQKRLRRHMADAVKPKQPDINAPIARTRWQPTDKPNPRMDIRLPGLMALDHNSSAPPTNKTPIKSRPLTKEALADGIIRNIWRVELLEEVEGNGQLELSLRPWQLHLLLNAGRDKATFETIASTRKAKLQVHRGDNVVRITADKNAAEFAANDIEDALRNAEMATVPMKGWNVHLYDPRLGPAENKERFGTSDATRLFAQKDIDHVAELTRTDISLDIGHGALVIRGFDNTSITEAKQYLLRLLPTRDHVERTCDTEKIDAAIGDCFLVPAVHEPTSLDYFYRDMALGRWSLPTPRLRKAPTGSDAYETSKSEATEVNVGGLKEPKHIYDNQVHEVVSKMQRQPKRLTAPEKVGFWASGTEYSVSAEFGQALFPLAKPDPTSIAVALDTPGRKLPFQSTFPNMVNFLATSDIKLGKDLESDLQYDFVPAPKQRGFKTGRRFPNLRIRMRTLRDGRQCQLAGISLGFPWQDHVHTVLLPDQATDVRFRRSESLGFDVDGHDDANINEWLEAVRANIVSGERLTAPSLCLQIPRWTVPYNRMDVPELLDSGKSLMVDYLFTGVRFHQTAIGTSEETGFSYSAIQSDSMGATGSGLRAYPPLNSSGGSSEDKDDMNAFVRRCLETADKMTQASASHRPVPKVSTPTEERKPRDMQSNRKIRRAALQQNMEEDAQDGVVAVSDEGPVEANSAVEQEDEPESTSSLDTTAAVADDLVQPPEQSQTIDEQASSAINELAESTEPIIPIDAAPVDTTPTDTAPVSEDVQNQPKP